MRIKVLPCLIGAQNAKAQIMKNEPHDIASICRLTVLLRQKIKARGIYDKCKTG
jgi:hypothetical protein